MADYQVLMYDGATPYDITCDVYSIAISRGRTNELEQIDPGRCVLRVRNSSRDFDPDFGVGSPTFLLMETGDYLLLESGDRITLEQDQSLTTGAYGPIVLGRKVEVYDGAVLVSTTTVEDYDHEWNRTVAAVASISCADAMSALAAAEMSEWTADMYDRPGERIAKVLDRDEVGYPTGAAFRNLSDGLNPLQDDLIEEGTRVLPYVQDCARSDLGRLFSTRADVLTYIDRYATRTAPVVASFGDGGYQFARVGVRYGSERLHFRVSVDRVNGEPKISTNQTAIDDNPRRGARQYRYGPTLTNHDAYSEATSEYLVGVLSSPLATLDQVDVILNAFTTGDRAIIAALELGDLVAVTFTPTCAGVTIGPIELVVEGIEYTVSTQNRQVRMTLFLSPRPDLSNVFVLDVNRLDGSTGLGH